jgi:hypothetical protein
MRILETIYPVPDLRASELVEDTLTSFILCTIKN